MIDRRSGRTAWREMGEGVPLLFLHGLGGSRASWNPQLAALSEDRRCIAWDMPGYGDSDPEERLTYETIADRLAEFLDELNLETVDMVGLSFGGMHAMHTAVRYPNRVGRMVLASTSPAFGMDGTLPEQWKAARVAPLDQGETPATIAGGVLDSLVANPLSIGVRSELIGSFARIPAAGFRAAVECLPSNDIRPQLHQISHPSLVLVGDHDQETPVAYAQTLVDGLPNAELVVLDGVGHLSPSEAPDEFNHHVREFLGLT